MARSAKKPKQKGKNGKKIKEATSASASKNKPSKRGKFSAKNKDILHIPQNPVFGSPTAYLYGNQAIDAKEVKKRKRQGDDQEYGGRQRKKKKFDAVSERRQHQKDLL